MNYKWKKGKDLSQKKKNEIVNLLMKIIIIITSCKLYDVIKVNGILILRREKEIYFY